MAWHRPGEKPLSELPMVSKTCWYNMDEKIKCDLCPVPTFEYVYVNKKEVDT